MIKFVNLLRAFILGSPTNYSDDLNYLVQLKQKLQMENIICIDEGNPNKFEQFEFILDNI